MMKGINIMKITVKRRTWFLGWLMPISIKFNGETIGSVGGYHTKEFDIPRESGILTYEQPLDKTDRVRVEEGDTIYVRETVLSKVGNVLFLSLFIFIISFNINTLITGEFFESQTIGIITMIVFILFIGVTITSLFFNSYKFVIENQS